MRASSTHLVPSAKIKREDFDHVIDVNLKGTFYVTQIFGRKMLKRGLREGYIDIVQVALFGEKGLSSLCDRKAGCSS